MAVNKVVLGDQTLIDLTADSVTPDKLFKGITAHNMKGESIVGTMEGGSTPSEPSDNTAVIFADYDGNLIDTWTKDEVASKTTLPTPPAHTGLVFEGWNWTLEDIQTDTTGQVITVGPFYHTESGYSEYDVEVSFQRGMTMSLDTDKGRYSYIDWGDGTVITEAVEDNPSHTYSQAGNYTIKIALEMTQGTSVPSPQHNIKAIRYGVDVKYRSIDTSAEYVTIPSDMSWNYGDVVFKNAKQITAPKDSLGDYCIKGKNLVYVAMVKELVTANAKNSLGSGGKSKYTYIPSSVTSIGNQAFYNCYSLQSIIIPSNVTSIEQQAFYNCSSLQSITIPSSVTSIGGYAFYNCFSLQSITIPENVTSIGNNAFQSCSSLQSITIPESVTSIGNQAFNGCNSIYFAEIKSDAKINSSTYNFGSQTLYDFSGCKSIPVLGSSSGLNSLINTTAIYVPLSLYDEWKEATNWAAYASKIQPKGEGIVAFNGVGKLVYNEATTLNASYVSDTEPTNITITASNPDALEIGQYTIDNTAKTITIPVTAKSVTDTVTVTLNATFKDGVQSKTLSIKIKESFKAPSFTVTDVEGASYNFVLNDAGYYESTNKGVADSAALCKLDITDLEDTTRVIFDCINSGEADYDYGMISKINTTLGTTNSEDSASNLFASFKGQSSTNVVTKSYPIDNVAACFFTLKFRKDGSGDQGNDSLQFKVRFE